MGMTKTYSIGTNKVVIDLKKEFQGGNYGARGMRVVEILFGGDDIYFDKGKYVRTSEKEYTSASVIVGTGVDDVTATLQFATGVDYDIKVGQNVLLRDGSTDLGVVKILTISEDRKIVKVAKVDNFNFSGATPKLVLAKSGKYMTGDKFKYHFGVNSVISLQGISGGGDNLTIKLEDTNYNMN